jgi:hypothetical protein
VETDNWVRNKQTVDVSFYVLKGKKLLYKNSFCEHNKLVAGRVFNSFVTKNKLNKKLYSVLKPFLIFYYLLFFHKCLNPFSHVTVSFKGVHHETREGKHFWRAEPIKGDRYKLTKTVTIECNTIPSSEDLFKYTKNLPTHKGAHCPLALAYGIVYVFFPIRILGYPRLTNDCVTVTSHLLQMFGIETNKSAWTPKMLYDDLIKKEIV